MGDGLSAVRGSRLGRPLCLDLILPWNGHRGGAYLPLALKRPIRSAELEFVPPRQRFGRFEKGEGAWGLRPFCGVASDAETKTSAWIGFA